jgi:uncharacterized protein with HEPN domain
LLSDILKATTEINSFIAKIRDFDEFKDDIKTQRATERNIEIIGEAVKRILNSSQYFPLENARKIVDTRNRIIHGYDSVSTEII